ncbi:MULTISPECIES: Hpt domain-containing protein [unclassified Devosia]|uniref:Hpt domain-containing protein n=1 Tax=unclassified Devosia TaxID=196773 RepID=UPI000FD6D5EB|nr:MULTISPECIES: Hpt domain-containing protein [unclassified Devosia]
MANPSASLPQQFSPSEANKGGPIDRLHLARQCLGDEGLEQEVLRLFHDTIKSYMARLQRAEDGAETRIALHTLKGAARGVGAWTVADQAQAAEEELADAAVVGPERFADLAMAVEEVSVFIAGMLTDDLN